MVDVMITIICDFCQFSAKSFAFFLKNNFMMQILQKLAVHSLNKKKTASKPGNKNTYLGMNFLTWMQ
jgi:hypothetical protein